MSKQYRNTYVEINLPNLYDNYKNVQKIVKDTKIIPVVKANAYGHGLVEVVEYLVSKGVDQFAVSLLEEALELRANFKHIQILVMGIVEENGLLIASENNITLTISNLNQLKILPRFKKRLKIHLKIDTGMNRLGFKDDQEIIDTVTLLNNIEMITLEGIFTHFSTADVDKTYYDIQLSRFNEVLKMIDYDFQSIHVSNSSSAIKYENNIDFTTHFRLGISLYGLTLDDNVNFLKTTFTLKTCISQINYLNPGDKLGYGATYTAQQREIIAVLPIGYADGFIRKNKGGDVEINGKRYQIVGNICMDQMFIRIDEDVLKTDDVILFGGLISTDEVAKRLDTINYEVICGITSRVPRKYMN